MSITRRKFLGTGTLAALTAGMPIKALAEELINKPGAKDGLLLGRRSQSNSFYLDSAAFTRCLNTDFRVHTGTAGAVIVKLTEVAHWQRNSSKQPAAADGRECFSTIFCGRSGIALRQDTYLVEHPSLGKFNLLMVPIGSNKSGEIYEAVFNRLH